MTAYIKSKEFYKTNHNRGLAILIISIILSIFCSFFLYAFQSSKIISCSYEIRDKKEKLDSLKIENQNLAVEITQWRSLANLEEMVKSLDMVEAEQAVYFRMEKAVAKK